jgi:hypothetical protein
LNVGEKICVILLALILFFLLLRWHDDGGGGVSMWELMLWPVFARKVIEELLLFFPLIPGLESPRVR